MSGDSSNDGTLGRIALKQVRVKRSDVQARERPKAKPNEAAPAAREARSAEPAGNPLNRLVPYLDLFARLGDEELARLAGVDLEHAQTMRAQVDEISKMLAQYEDLIERLGEDELVRLTQATPKIVRFWLLCRPRKGGASTSGVYSQVSGAGDSGSEHRVANDASASSSGVRMQVAPAAPESGPVLRPAPAPSESAVDIAVDDAASESADEFDPVFAFEDDDEDDDDIDLF